MTQTIESLLARVAELEAENARLIGRPIPLSTWQKMEQQLAAAVLSNVQLREALSKCSEQLTRLGYSANHADQALSTPISTSALDKYVAEKVKEANDQILAAKNLLAIMHRDGGHHEFAVGFDQAIQDAMAVYYELTRQRDLAVEALEKAASVMWKSNDNLDIHATEIESTISTIKESEGK